MPDAPCPSTVQTAAGLSTTQGIDTRFDFSSREVEVLRGLAKETAEIAASPTQAEKARLWTLHNDLRPCRPLLFCDPENGWNEIIPQSALLCADPLARVWEMTLRKEIFWGTEMGDDRVVTSFFNVPYHYEDTGWGLKGAKIGGDHGGAYAWEKPLRDYERDFPSLRFPEIRIDGDKSAELMRLAEEVFGGILQPRRHSAWWWTLGMTWEYITLRGLDDFMLDMYDNPEWVHKTMAFLRDGTMAKLDFLESNGLLSGNHGDIYVGSGGFGWTGQLPPPGREPGPPRCSDLWGFAESQETVGVSPEMFAEFIFPYQLPILERFGLNCYGCCEPVDGRWRIVKNVPRLRRVSASAWVDVKTMAEALGPRYIYSSKPSPTPLSRAGADLASSREYVRRVLEEGAKHGCHVELVMKDNHTLGGSAANAVNWCRMARKEIERHA